MIHPEIQIIDFIDPLQIFSYFSHENGVVFLDSAQLQENCGRYSYIAIDPFAILTSKNGLIELDEKIYDVPANKIPPSTQMHDVASENNFINSEQDVLFVSQKQILKKGIAIRRSTFRGDPFLLIKNYLAKFYCQFHPLFPPFQGGLAGLFSYDLYQHLEKIPLHRDDDLKFQDLTVGFYDLVIAFDLLLKKAWIFATGFPLSGSTRLQNARERIAGLQEKIALMAVNRMAQPQIKIPDQRMSQTQKKNSNTQDNPQSQRDLAKGDNICEDIHSKLSPFRNAIQSNFSAASYQQAVNKVIKYILAGDIFEANISQRFKTDLPKNLDAFELYKKLRAVNPAPFACYLNFEGQIIASASPERFLKLVDRKVETRPIKGTRARGVTPEEDEKNKQELLMSEKDNAENVMIVDLLRNDLSKVCEDASVNVLKLCGIETYATVHHLVSVITAILKSQYTPTDLLRATFPGGSITGTPKIRAMEIIAEVESNRRGPYCGTVAYIGFNGDMDSSIVIRTYAIKDNIVTFHAGGAVVLDSNPLQEYEETLAKVGALFKALGCEFNENR